MLKNTKIAGVILAAGKSSRMGFPKQLLPFKGKPMLVHIINHALKSNLDEVIVVLGCHSEKIKEQVPSDSVNMVINRDFDKGQSSSLKAGIKTISSEYDGVMFLLCDMPFIDETIINRVIEGYKSTEKEIVMAACNKRRGHPVIFHRSLFQELLQISEKDEGARSVLKKYPDRIELIDIPNENIFLDIDNPEDYQYLLNYPDKPLKGV